ncbi:hypothetical protein NZJ93_02050 [Desulfofundulus thermocisternus]|nr:hypothetical protein [Desulfofundulus thermocisternus]
MEAAGTMDWSEAVPYPHHAPHRRRLARVFLHRLLPVPVKAERNEPGKIFVSLGGINAGYFYSAVGQFYLHIVGQFY